MDKDKILSSWNLRIPIVSAPMFLISNPQMVIASLSQGIIGTFPALNQRTSEGFENWLIQIKEYSQLSDAPLPPFGVNIIVHKSNPRLKTDLALCIKHEVPIVITSLGAVPDVIEQVHSYGGIVLHDVTNAYHARKASDAGVDGLILVCAGAGGHAGTISPFALMNEVRSFFDGIILLAGAISTGRDIASALQMGGDLAYMGTRFINTEESHASPAYKEMIIESTALDIVYTDAVSGIHANFMKNSLDAAGISNKHDAKLDFGSGIEAEAKAWKNIWSAGHGVSQIHENLSIGTLVDRLQTEFTQAIQEHLYRSQKYTTKANT